MSGDATIPSSSAPKSRRELAAEFASSRIFGAASMVARGAAAAAKQRPKDALRWFSIVSMTGLLLAFIWASFFSPWVSPILVPATGNVPMNVDEFRRAFRDGLDARDAKVVPATDPSLISLARGVENLASEMKDMRTASAAERSEIRKEIHDQSVRIDRVLEFLTKTPR